MKEKTMIRKTAIVMFLFLFVAASSGMAGDDKKHRHGTKANSPKTFEGTLVCLGCSLGKEEGAHSECKVFGHDHALKIGDGKYISFLPNKFSKDLISGEKYHNAQVSVTGTFFAKANTLDVESFKVEGKAKTWCTECSAMDSHGAGM